MKDMYFNSNEELNDYIRKSYIKPLGAGREGSCFLLPDDIVVKTVKDYFRDYVLRFKDVDNKTFIFPKAVCMVDDLVEAYFMDYAKGKNIYDSPIDGIEFEKLAGILTRLVSDVKRLSNLGIEINDCVNVNMIYDGEMIRIIDTLRYEWLSNRSEFESNIRMVMKTIYDNLLIGMPYDRRVYVNTGMYYDMYLLNHPDEVIYDFKEKANRSFDEEVSSIKDIKRLLKK